MRATYLRHGLRHEDLNIAERQLAVVARDNDNRARAKGGRSRFIPTSSELMRLYADYLNDEYRSRGAAGHRGADR